LGVVLEELGRPADARQAYATAVEIDPTHHRALNHVALSYQSEGNLEMAETLFRRALQVAPKDLVANVGLGMILLHTGRAAEAQRPLRIALQQRPDDPRLRQALAAAGAS
jgi:Flp pilus assembly protein TadD